QPVTGQTCRQAQQRIAGDAARLKPQVVPRVALEWPDGDGSPASDRRLLQRRAHRHAVEAAGAAHQQYGDDQGPAVHCRRVSFQVARLASEATSQKAKKAIEYTEYGSGSASPIARISCGSNDAKTMISSRQAAMKGGQRAGIRSVEVGGQVR